MKNFEPKVFSKILNFWILFSILLNYIKSNQNYDYNNNTIETLEGKIIKY
jgi:hypothetical protein